MIKLLYKEIFYEFRQLRKQFPDKFSTYTQNGYVFVKLNGGSPKRVSTKEEMQATISSVTE